MLNVVIIGCGQIAGGYDYSRPDDALPLTHAAAYRRDGGFRLLACVDPDAAQRGAFAARWGVEHELADVADIAALGDRIDVVSICTPTALHAAHLEAALALKPRLVFCEKPLTADVATSEAMVARFAEAGVLLAVNHNRRWDPKMGELARALKAGELGALRSVVATYNKGVFNNGSHMIDLLHRLIGPMRVVATGAPVCDFWPDDPTIPALLETVEGGVPVHLVTAHAADYALFELTLVTASGVYTMQDGGRGWRERRTEASVDFPGYQVLTSAVEGEGGYDHSTLAAIANIRAALNDGAALASDGATALAAQRFCAQIHYQAMCATDTKLSEGLG
jgi:predicted dehydrogenase